MNETSPPKKLTRSRNDRFVGGVAAGIANHFSIDPVFVRIALVISLLFGGLGLLAYGVLLAVMPVEGDPEAPLPAIEPKRRNMMIGLAVLVGIFALFTADSGGFASWIFGFWPGTVFGILFWVAAGAVLVWMLASGAFSRDGQSPTDAERGPAPVPPADTSPSTEVVTYAESPTQLSRTEVMETRQMESSPEGEAEPSTAPVRDDAPSTIGKIMLWVAIGTAALMVFSTLFVVSAGATAIFGGVPMAALVIILGGGMVFAALRGRRQLSLWLLTAAIAVTLPMAAVSIADLRVEGPYGEIKKTPMSVVDIPDDGYEMAAGNLTVDLRRFEFGGPGASARPALEIPVRSGMGLTSIIVPDDVCVLGQVEGKAGVVNFRGRQTSGLNISQAAELSTEGNIPRTVIVDGEFKLGAFEVVDSSQWRQEGRAGSFDENDFEPDGKASAEARDRATAACAAPVEILKQKVKR